MKQFVIRPCADSYCVVYKSKEVYINCRKHGTDKTKIEVVYSGQVRTNIIVNNEWAPETVIDIMKGL